jgi:hypothetical protein
MSPLVYDIMLGRLREPPGKLWLCTTPRGRNWVWRLFQEGGPDHHKIKAPTWTNTFLPPSFLPSLRARYGDSTFARQEIEGEEVDDDTDVLIPSAWLDRAFSARHDGEGPTRIGVDLGSGSGGDRTVIVARDDAGILELKWSRSWGLEAAARQVAMMQARWRVAPGRTAYDRAGIGEDFAHRLDAAGVVGGRGYRGGVSGGHRFSNLRTAAAWLLRSALDPGGRGVLRADDDDGGLYRARGLGFSIPREYESILRPELAACRWKIDGDRRIALTPKDELTSDLGHSPDVADALIISFAFPYA